MDLTGRLAVVTGASRGIGRAVAVALAAAGAKVHAVARGPDALAGLAAEADGIVPWAADATDPAFAAALEALPVDILVNNAGINHPMPMADVPLDVLDRMIDVNLRAAFRVAQAAVRTMLRHGRGGAIVHMTSQMGHVGSPGRTVYCMTKHGLEGLSKAMAVELAPHDIRVNCVAPTFIETPLTEPMLADPEFRRFVLDRIPLGRVGAPEDVAAAVLYLVSPGARMVTGTSLKVDGGWTAQ
jgi:NAD(P)-dependent dehydrogenase (short-subunit alcohol dehydrogenase family)